MKLVSVHVPKSAGFSFRDHLTHLFGKKRVIWDYNHTDRPDYKPEPPTPYLLAQLRTNKTTVIHGHFFLSRYRHIPGLQRAMWFRDPVERLLSHYYYWQHAVDMDHPNCRKLHEEALSAAEFAAIPELRNIYARFLDDEPLAELNWIGLVEDYQSSLDLFYAMYAVGRDPNEINVHLNKNRGRQGDNYELSSKERGKIERLNAEDMDLYSEAKTIFGRLADRYGKGY
jgi:hypothetical protein